MPLVFVHGVNTREGTTTEEKEKFKRQIEKRDDLFRTIGLAGLVKTPNHLYIKNPYWGGHAADFTHDLVSVPVPGTELFGTAGDNEMFQILIETLPITTATQLENEPDVETALLLRMARENPKTMLPLVVDALVAGCASEMSTGDGNGALADGELARFADAAIAYVNGAPDKSPPRFDWLFARDVRSGRTSLNTDDEFLEALTREVQNSRPRQDVTEFFGGSQLLESLKGTAATFGNVARRAVAVLAGVGKGAAIGAIASGAPGGAPIVRRIRPAATQRAGIFVGDVFAYLKTRGDKNKPGDIVRIIRDAINASKLRITAEDPKMVVVAHSMGGNIVYDIVTHFDPDLKIDVFVTVGSQVALFKELKLYREDDDKSPASSALICKPNNIGLWINIFDPLDVLGFAAEGVFRGVKDFAFSTQASPLDAHSTYFIRPNFHARLRARLAEAGLDVAI